MGDQLLALRGAAQGSWLVHRARGFCSKADTTVSPDPSCMLLIELSKLVQLFGSGCVKGHLKTNPESKFVGVVRMLIARGIDALV